MIELPPLFADALSSAPAGPSRPRDLTRFTPDGVVGALGPFLRGDDRDRAVSVYGDILQLIEQALQEGEDGPDPVEEAVWSQKLQGNPRAEAAVPLLSRPGTIYDYLHGFAPSARDDVGRFTYPGRHGESPRIVINTPGRYSVLSALLANPYQRAAGVSAFDEEDNLLGSLLTGTVLDRDEILSAARNLVVRHPKTAKFVPFAHGPVLTPRSRSALAETSDEFWRGISKALKEARSARTVEDVLHTSPREFWSQKNRVWGRVADDFDRLPPVSKATIRAVTGPSASRAAGLKGDDWTGAFPVDGSEPAPLYDALGSGAETLDADGLIVTPPARDIAAREGLGSALAQRGLTLLEY